MNEIFLNKCIRQIRISCIYTSSFEQMSLLYYNYGNLDSQCKWYYKLIKVYISIAVS